MYTRETIKPALKLITTDSFQRVVPVNSNAKSWLVLGAGQLKSRTANCFNAKHAVADLKFEPKVHTPMANRTLR